MRLKTILYVRCITSKIQPIKKTNNKNIVFFCLCVPVQTFWAFLLPTFWRLGRALVVVGISIFTTRNVHPKQQPWKEYLLLDSRKCSPIKANVRTAEAAGGGCKECMAREHINQTAPSKTTERASNYAAVKSWIKSPSIHPSSLPSPGKSTKNT